MCFSASTQYKMSTWNVRNGISILIVIILLFIISYSVLPGKMLFLLTVVIVVMCTTLLSVRHSMAGRTTGKAVTISLRITKVYLNLGLTSARVHSVDCSVT